jgi:hypothetical protein
MRTASFALLLGTFQGFAFGGVLDGSDYVPRSSDTYVSANAGACCIGEYYSVTNVYMAQTFEATGKVPKSLTLGLANNQPADVPPASFRFRLLLVEVVHSGFLPGKILWESDDLSIPADGLGYREVTHDINGVKLTPGRVYAWILDTFSTRDGQQDVGAFQGNTIINADVGRLWMATATGAGRSVDFTQTWSYANMSAAFLLRYASPR